MKHIGEIHNIEVTRDASQNRVMVAIEGSKDTITGTISEKSRAAKLHRQFHKAFRYLRKL